MIIWILSRFEQDPVQDLDKNRRKNSFPGSRWLLLGILPRFQNLKNLNKFRFNTQKNPHYFYRSFYIGLKIQKSNQISFNYKLESMDKWIEKLNRQIRTFLWILLTLYKTWSNILRIKWSTFQFYLQVNLTNF